jgi:ligand-binding SRPBCC domain-containing protein
MRVALRLVLDCPPDAAWEALQSPDVFREVFHPLANVEPIDPPTFPERWPDGPSLLRITSFSGLIPLGEQLSDLSRHERDDVRILEDSGHPVTGPLASLTLWRHRMAVAPAENGTTLYRDRLDFRGPAAVAYWPVLWELWQYRGGKLKKLAPTFEKRFRR